MTHLQRVFLCSSANVSRNDSDLQLDYQFGFSRILWVTNSTGDIWATTGIPSVSMEQHLQSSDNPYCWWSVMATLKNIRKPWLFFRHLTFFLSEVNTSSQRETAALYQNSRLGCGKLSFGGCQAEDPLQAFPLSWAVGQKKPLGFWEGAPVVSVLLRQKQQEASSQGGEPHTGHLGIRARHAAGNQD